MSETGDDAEGNDPEGNDSPEDVEASSEAADGVESKAEAAAAAYRRELAGDIWKWTEEFSFDETDEEVAGKKKHWWNRKRPTGVVPVSEVDAELRMKGAAARSAESDVTLKKVVGYGALAFMVLQIAIADYIFYLYGDTRKWDVPKEVICFWLGATVVQVAVIVRTVATYLFPSSGGQ